MSLTHECQNEARDCTGRVSCALPCPSMDGEQPHLCLPCDAEKAARILEPYLWRASTAGWPGLSERERNEATDALWDLHVTLLELQPVKA